jgi:hypothetical protein
MPSPSLQKSPPELIERFTAALPSHPELVRKPMFGYPAAFVHGNMVCGLFQDAVVVRLGKEQAAEAVTSGAALQFEPMAGRPMTGFVLLRPADAEDPTALSSWLTRALNHTLTLPKKVAGKKVAGKKVAGKKAAKAVIKP